MAGVAWLSPCLLAALSVFLTPGQCAFQRIDLQSADVRCNMSSVYDSSLHGESMNCTGAINNNESLVWTPIQDPHPNCVYTTYVKNGINQYWLLDLGQSHNIHSITIYPETSDDFMNGIHVLVEGTEIFQFSSPQPKHPLPLTGGKLPIKGQIIKLDRNTDGFVTLCELQVDECTVNTYGVNCTKTCSPGCFTSGDSTTCDSISGNCTQGCALGYYGGRCDSLCGKGCVKNNCNRQDGSCTCLTGWTSPDCTKCDSGYYGVESCEECGYCRDDDVCNNTNGHCPRGCRDGFDGDRCDKCASNRWSSDCSLSCGQCAGDGSCYMNTGHCVNGCVQGFGGDNCTLEIVVSTVSPQDDGNLTGPIVGGLLGAGALIGISVLLAAFMIIRRRRKSRDTPKPADTDSAHVSSEITPVRDVTEGDKPETETPGNESNYAQLERYENPDDIRPYSMLQDGGKLPKYINIQSDQETAFYENTTVSQN